MSMISPLTVDERYAYACDNADAALVYYDRGDVPKALLTNVVANVRKGGRSDAECRTYWPSVRKLATRQVPEMYAQGHVPPPESPSEWAASAVEAILRCIIADNHGYLREENAAAAAVVMTA
ncbi:MAG: hypothetical protein WC700_18390, partial [Gemmatimonadaceae bacterium]